MLNMFSCIVLIIIMILRSMVLMPAQYILTLPDIPIYVKVNFFMVKYLIPV